MHERISRVSAARPMFINGWIEEACGEKLARDDLDVRDPKALVNILDEPPNLAPSGFMQIVPLPPPERLVDDPPALAPGDTIRISTPDGTESQAVVDTVVVPDGPFWFARSPREPSDMTVALRRPCPPGEPGPCPTCSCKTGAKHGKHCSRRGCSCHVVAGLTGKKGTSE